MAAAALVIAVFTPYFAVSLLLLLAIAIYVFSTRRARPTARPVR